MGQFEISNVSFTISIYWVLKAIFNIDTSTIIIAYFWFEKMCTLTMNTNSSTVGWKGISKNSKCQPSDPYLVIFGFISDMKMGVSKIWYLINQKLSCFENLLHFVPRVGQNGKFQKHFFQVHITSKPLSIIKIHEKWMRRVNQIHSLKFWNHLWNYFTAKRYESN